MVVNFGKWHLTLICPAEIKRNQVFWKNLGTKRVFIFTHRTNFALIVIPIVNGTVFA